MAQQQYLTPTEIAARFRVTRRTVANWIARGVLASVRIGKVTRIPIEAVETLERPTAAA